MIKHADPVQADRGAGHPAGRPDGPGRDRHRGRRQPRRPGRPGQRPDGLRHPCRTWCTSCSASATCRPPGSGAAATPAGGVVAQRVAVNQALETFRQDVADSQRGLGVPGAGRRRRRRAREAHRPARADRQRRGHDVERTLNYYSGHRQPARRQPGDRRPDRRPGPDPQRRHLRLLARLKEATSLERGRLYAVASVGSSRPRLPALAPIVGAQEPGGPSSTPRQRPSSAPSSTAPCRAPDINRAEELRARS